MGKMAEKLYGPWRNKAFEEIKRSDVSDILDDIEENRGPKAADVTLAILRRTMSKHAVAHDDYSSPIRESMARIEKVSPGFRHRRAFNSRILRSDNHILPIARSLQTV
jgi:hypothetical protein